MWRRLVKFDSDTAIESILRIREKLRQQPATINPSSPVVDESSSAKSPTIVTPLSVPIEIPPTLIPAVEISSTNIQLKTEKADYTKLRDLLATGKWKEADKKTAMVMLKVANREEEEWLRIEDIDNFPCEDLKIIDQLWVDYSKGKFGFSVQKEIYQSLGGTREYNKEVWNQFGDAVGWRVNNEWLYYSDITFRYWAPQGHLPIWLHKDISLFYYWQGGSRGVSSLVSRLVDCNI